MFFFFRYKQFSLTLECLEKEIEDRLRTDRLLLPSTLHVFRLAVKSVRNIAVPSVQVGLRLGYFWIGFDDFF